MPAHKFWPAAAIHVFTASGAVLGILALEAVAEGRFEAVFAWLGAAFVVDGIDGPLARRFHVNANLPRFSGERLDLIIDYLNYVAVPAFLVFRGGLVPNGLATISAALILLSALFHFADGKSKTADGFFVGFPALWNVAVFFALAFAAPPGLCFAALVLLAGLTFVPVTWVHPVRVRNWRPITALMSLAWAGTAIAIIVHGFPAASWAKIVLGVTAAYFILLGLSRSFQRVHFNRSR